MIKVRVRKHQLHYLSAGQVEPRKNRQLIARYCDTQVSRDQQHPLLRAECNLPKKNLPASLDHENWHKVYVFDRTVDDTEGMLEHTEVHLY